MIRKHFATPNKSRLVMKQRNKMRELFQMYEGDEARVTQAYAEAEQRGEVSRKSDLRNRTTPDYAARLFEDGVRKGWIHEVSWNGLTNHSPRDSSPLRSDISA